jgi:hypothetical protein
VPRVGLVRFATVALEAARAVVPDYRLPRSKHTFTQPQLLAVLCLMRYDDWTFRDAETRLAEHRELRRALRLRRVPDHTTLWRFLDRLPLAVLQDLLAEVLRRCGGTPPPGRGGGRRRRATVAIDATGLATGSVSTFFVRRLAELKGQGRERAWWLKWLVVLDVDRQLILGQTAHRGPRRDSAAVRALLAHAPGVQTLAHAHALAWVVGDKEFDSEANHAFIHDARSRSRGVGSRGRPTAPPSPRAGCRRSIGGACSSRASSRRSSVRRAAWRRAAGSRTRSSRRTSSASAMTWPASSNSAPPHDVN